MVVDACRVRRHLSRPCVLAAIAAISAAPFGSALGQGTEGSTPRVKAAERVAEAIDKEKGLSPDTRAAIRDLMEALRSDPAFGAPPPPAAPAGRAAPAAERSIWEKFAERLTPYGDFRLREEYTFRRDDQPDRNRVRIRLRLGVDVRIVDEITVGVRVRTGNPDDPNSPHQTFGNAFRTFELNLDRAFLSYRPRWAEGLVLIGGKFAHPFYRNPVYKELIWDGDEQPEGGAVGYALPVGGAIEKVELWAGEYVLAEQDLGPEATLTAVQTAVHFRVTEEARGTAAIGYYHYEDPDPGRSDILASENAGNAIVGYDTDADGFDDEFNFVAQFGILNPILALTYETPTVPVTVSAEYLLNTRTGTEGRNQGWGLGFAVGRKEKQGDWRVFYQWAVIEREAVFSAFANDDYHLQTNRRGHLFGGTYEIFDDVSLRLWAIVQQREHRDRSSATADSDKAQWRARAEINIKF